MPKTEPSLFRGNCSAAKEYCAARVGNSVSGRDIGGRGFIFLRETTSAYQSKIKRTNLTATDWSKP